MKRFKCGPKQYFQEYCNHTSIHGFQYLGEKKRFFLERIWWLVTISVSFTFCGFLIVDTYRRWDQSPIIVTFATTETPIWKIPFPAVTICPQVKANPKLHNYTQILQKLQKKEKVSIEDQVHFEQMSLVCRFREDVNYTWKYLDGPELYDFYNNVTEYTRRFLFLSVYFNGEPFPPQKGFTSIHTDVGVCYTFNMLDKHEILRDTTFGYRNYHSCPQSSGGWNIESSTYESDYDEEWIYYPRRVYSSGILASLKFNLLTAVDEIDYTCNAGIQGFKIHVHHPAELPTINEDFFMVPHDQSVTAAVTPHMILTSDEIVKYKWEKRGCYFPSEKRLHYFKSYTQSNCLLECRTNYTLASCGCVRFSMPHDNVTLICGGASLDCLREAEKNFRTNFFLTTIDGDEVISYVPLADCGCLPTCTTLTYTVETSQSEWEWRNVMKAEDTLKNRTEFMYNFSLSRAMIFFKTNQFIPSERHELYSPTDLLANFGGLLGLFTGFSLLSFLEIIYFLSLRIYCNIKMRKKVKHSIV